MTAATPKHRIATYMQVTPRAPYYGWRAPHFQRIWGLSGINRQLRWLMEGSGICRIPHTVQRTRWIYEDEQRKLKSRYRYEQADITELRAEWKRIHASRENWQRIRDDNDAICRAMGLQSAKAIDESYRCETDAERSQRQDREELRHVWQGISERREAVNLAKQEESMRAATINARKWSDHQFDTVLLPRYHAASDMTKYTKPRDIAERVAAPCPRRA